MNEPDCHLLHVIDCFITHCVQALATCLAHLSFVSRHINLERVGLVCGFLPVHCLLASGIGEGCVAGNRTEDAIALRSLRIEHKRDKSFDCIHVFSRREPLRDSREPFGWVDREQEKQ